MRILIAGGTGFLGTALRRSLESEGHSFSCLSRTRSGSEGGTTFVPMQALSALEPHDAVVNLAGESVVGLWTPKKRRQIHDSRIGITDALVRWISESKSKPSVFLSGSAVGIYGDRGAEVVDESTGIFSSSGFLAQVCRDWEASAAKAPVRTVMLRTGQVLDPSGGYLAKVLPIFRRFPIVVLGPNDSYFPWIALQDWVGIAKLALDDSGISGPLDLVSPAPVTQKELTHEFGRCLSKRVWGRVPRWLLEIGAGEFGRSLTASQRAVPSKAVAHGYQFQFTTLPYYLNAALSHPTRS